MFQFWDDIGCKLIDLVCYSDIVTTFNTQRFIIQILLMKKTLLFPIFLFCSLHLFFPIIHRIILLKNFIL